MVAPGAARGAESSRFRVSFSPARRFWRVSAASPRALIDFRGAAALLVTGAMCLLALVAGRPRASKIS